MTPAIVGRGRVGTALGAALGLEVLGSRAAVPVRDAYVLAVRDAAIAEVAATVVRASPDAVLLHTAGGVPSKILRDAGARSAAVLHPLVAFAGPAPTLAGALFAIEGDEKGAALALELVAALRGVPLRLDAPKLARYHAAAALASNHVLGLVDRGRRMLVELGADPAVAQSALASLFGSVAMNLSARGLPDALTGPIARGDVATIDRHLAALGPDERALYITTAVPLLALAEGRTAPEDLAAIRSLLILYASEAVD